MKFDPAIVQTTCPSPLGRITLAATAKGLAGLWFIEDQRHLPPELSGPAVWRCDPGHPILKKTSQQLAEYFAGQRKNFDVALNLTCGTDFQQAVWQALLLIPFGRTASYGDISRRIGNPNAVRAVGAAVGRNPVGIIVPCHRVMGADGSLTGYAGGLQRKTALLRLEGVLAEELL